MEEFRQVITIGRGGQMSGLQRKDGIDLRQFGHAKIERTSEVAWDANEQKFYVAFKHCPSNPVLTNRLYNEAYEVAEVFDNDKPVYFKEYDDAVKAEIFVLDYLRLRGVLCNVS